MVYITKPRNRKIVFSPCYSVNISVFSTKSKLVATAFYNLHIPLPIVVFWITKWICKTYDFVA